MCVAAEKGRLAAKGYGHWGKTRPTLISLARTVLGEWSDKMDDDELARAGQHIRCKDRVVVSVVLVVSMGPLW